jgi:hypothetical protein
MTEPHKRYKSMTALLGVMVLLWPQVLPGQQDFPIPKMQVEWPSSGLSNRDYGLLTHTIKSAFADCDNGSRDFRFEYALVDLGKLGKGVLVRTLEPCHCGATGNCAIHVYVRDSNTYREIPFKEHREPWGWAWGVVKSNSDVPELAFGSNGGGGCQGLGLYRYSGGVFVVLANEAVRLKDEAQVPSPADWWDPSAVLVRPSC